MNTDRRLTISFKTSADADSKKNHESVDTTTTVIFKDWTEADFDIAAVSNVKINQIQPKIRNGERIGREFIAARPGTKGITLVSAWDALVVMYQGDKIKAARMSDLYGGADRAMEKLRMLQEQAEADMVKEEFPG